MPRLARRWIATLLFGLALTFGLTTLPKMSNAGHSIPSNVLAEDPGGQSGGGG